MATKHTVEVAVTEILRSSDIDSITEAQVRAMAAAKLGLDLDDLPYKILVREIIESFLLSTAPAEDDVAAKIDAAVAEIAKSSDLNVLTVREVLDMVRGKVGLDVFVLPHSDVIRHVIMSYSGDDMAAQAEMQRRIGHAGEEVLKSCDMKMRDVLAMVSKKFGLPKVWDSLFNSASNQNENGEEEDRKPVSAQVAKQSPIAGDCCRVICKLSNKRDIAVRGSGEKTEVSIRELIWKDGKQMPSPKGISLSNDQWSIFRNSIPAIEEAIQKVEARLRSELERKQAEDKHARSQHESQQNDGTQSRAELNQNGMHHGLRPVASRKHAEASTVGSAPQGVVPIGIIRFDGKNYLQWADRMESYLNQLKIAYVLSNPCPSTAGVIDRELRQTLSALQKWIDDDHICRQNILNSLCDYLFRYYSKKSGTARDLWEELKLIYFNEEYGAKVSLVKKYIEFQMVEEKSLFEQIQELNEIADSLIASGMYVEEKFHVNVIISKLPSSWKPFTMQLMKEDYLPVWMLMNLLKAEEETRGKGDRGEAILRRPELPICQPDQRLGPQRIHMKKPGVPPPNHEPDRDRRVKFCTVCKKKGHVPEQCWFRKTGGKDTPPSEKGSAGSVHVVAGRNTAGITD